MKARGLYLIGIDFGAGDQFKVLAVPVHKMTPLFHKAESLSTDEFDRVIEEARRAAREKAKG